MITTKKYVLHAAYRLKGIAFSVGEDIFLSVRQGRKHLWSSCTSERERVIKV